MLALLILLGACGAPETEEAVLPAAADVYLDGMWAQRALTVGAGLEEAQLLWATGEKERARELVNAVVRGSFEPELEPLLRQRVDPRLATELEFRLGVLREAMNGSSAPKVQAALQRVVDRLNEGAKLLDEQKATLQ